MLHFYLMFFMRMILYGLLQSNKKESRCFYGFFFKNYATVSGQYLSIGKCRFNVGAMSIQRKLQISRILGFSSGHFPFNYLGVPLFQGKPKTIYLQQNVDRIKSKLASWKGYLLSITGRVQLVKSIIHGMLAYSYMLGQFH